MAGTTVTYRCTGLSESARGWVNVNFTQQHDVAPDEDVSTVRPTGSLVLSLPEAEARNYFPGETYTINIAQVT